MHVATTKYELTCRMVKPEFRISPSMSSAIGTTSGFMSANVCCT